MSSLANESPSVYDRAMTSYYVYLVRCADDTYYTGVCTDTARRVLEHNGTSKGARYTRGRQPVRLAYEEPCPDRSSALKREHVVRQLSRSEKERLEKRWRAA